MTINSTTRIAGPFVGNGSTSVFPFAFKVFAASDVDVIQLTVATGVEATLVLTTDYTVTLNADQDSSPGGTITLTAGALASGYTLTITSDIANLQPTDLTNQGGFYPEVITDSLDRATIQIQQMSEDVGRSLKGPISDGSLNMELPTAALRANKYLVFDANGLPISSAGSGTDTALRTDLANTGVTTAGAGLVGFRANDATAVGRTVLSKLRDVVSVKDFGAVGDGVTNDTAAIQAAIDSVAAAGGTVFFPSGTYRVARQSGTNDKWGIKVTGSNITLLGFGNARLRRFDTNISTFALAYPILMIGTPDSNVAAQTSNVTITGLVFVGENVRHSTSGSALHDRRCAIELKNTYGVSIMSCVFEAIDSAAIYHQYPAIYDEAASAYYNTTRNFKSRICDCQFIATSHATVGRALIYAIDVTGVIDCNINDNQFQWCDNAVNGGTTFNNFTETNASTWTPTYSGWTLGAVGRTGRNWTIDGNVISNCTENGVYIEGMNCAVTNNNIHIEDSAQSGGNGIKIRGRGITANANIITNFSTAISINESAINVSACGNTIVSSGTGTGGAIDINSDGLSAYIASKPWFSLDYKPMTSITVSGNAITFPTTAASSASHHSAFRIYTDITDANYPNGQILGISICGNTVKNLNTGVFVVNGLYRNAMVSGNSFAAKPFTESGFSSGTTVDTRAAMQVDVTATAALLYMAFTANHVHGAQYLIASTTGGGSAGTIDMPFGISSNRLDYIKDFATADIKSIGAVNRFVDNVGRSWLDRTFDATAIGNSFGDATGTSNSFLNRVFLYDSGTNKIRFYTDDSGTFIAMP